MKNKKKKNKKPWGGRFGNTTSGITERISSSVEYDSRLYKQDIMGSIAHAKMLEKAGIISGKELKEIVQGLKKIEREIEDNRFSFSTSLEDIHMNIEARLTEMIGDAGRKASYGQVARNDQVVLDLKMYIRDRYKNIRALISGLISMLAGLAEENIDVIMPGYTHMQVAQPVRFSHHILAHAWALLRDLWRLDFFLKGTNILPLGAGALAGVNYDTDRDFLMSELGFNDITYNSMDTVSDRDFVLDFLYFASVVGMHLSRFCEDIIIWSTSEFDFIRLSDEVTTGSSIMPQKRNPDIAELIRGKTGRLYGDLIALLTTLKGLPLTYNRDLQEDKEPLFDAVDTLELSLSGMCEMLASLEVNAENMKRAVYRNYSTATDLADYLSQKGVPFRSAHEITGRIVRHCEEEGIDFFNMPLDMLKGFSRVFDDDINEVLNPETSTERKVSEGGTSKASVKKQVKLLKGYLS